MTLEGTNENQVPHNLLWEIKSNVVSKVSNKIR